MFGKNLENFKEWSKIGYVPQKVSNFDVNFPATVFEVVLMGRYGKRGLYKWTTDDDRKKAINALKEVDMHKFKDRLIGDLSSGQQQRVFIARALAGEPEILFLDEPTVGVEVQIRDEFYLLLQKLNRELKITIVLVTHDLENMIDKSMKVICIDHSLVFHNSVNEYLKDNGSITHKHQNYA